MKNEVRCRCRFVNCLAALALLAHLGGGVAAHAQQPLPDGAGRGEFQRICAACHGLELATKLAMPEESWAALVNEMVTIGATGTDEEFSRVVKYLGANFGPGHAGAAKGSGNAPRRSTAPGRNGRDAATTAAKPPAPSRDVSRGMALFESKNCLMCHRIGDKGSHVGPNLTNIGARRDSEKLLASIRNPDAEVLPENRFVQVVLKDGTAVRGRLLNHDATSVQLIDTKEKLRSFTVQQIRSYTILEKGLMPPEPDLSDQDVADIVNYLASLN
jgi:putative heme-binding domain-containing protein